MGFVPSFPSRAVASCSRTATGCSARRFEAEDAVQETYLRAWRGYWRRFEHRSSVRSWLYRIATNACLSALEQRGRRALPSGLGAPALDPDAPARRGRTPRRLAGTDAGRPGNPRVGRSRGDRRRARMAAARVIASLQYLPARQRAVLLLREVLGFPAAEVASMLGTSTPRPSRARCNEPARGWMRSRQHQSGSSSRPIRAPGNCSASTSPALRTPTPRPWRRRCAPTPRSRWSALARGSPVARPACGTSRT